MAGWLDWPHFGQCKGALMEVDMQHFSRQRTYLQLSGLTERSYKRRFRAGDACITVLAVYSCVAERKVTVRNSRP